MHLDTLLLHASFMGASQSPIDSQDLPCSFDLAPNGKLVMPVLQCLQELGDDGPFSGKVSACPQSASALPSRLSSAVTAEQSCSVINAAAFEATGGGSLHTMVTVMGFRTQPQNHSCAWSVTCTILSPISYLWCAPVVG